MATAYLKFGWIGLEITNDLNSCILWSHQFTPCKSCESNVLPWLSANACALSRSSWHTCKPTQDKTNPRVNKKEDGRLTPIHLESFRSTGLPCQLDPHMQVNLRCTQLSFYVLIQRNLFRRSMKWGLCEYVIVHTILPPSPVMLWIEMGGKLKKTPLNFAPPLFILEFQFWLQPVLISIENELVWWKNLKLNALAPLALFSHQAQHMWTMTSSYPSHNPAKAL